MPPTSPVIHVSGLTKYYGEVVGVRDIAFSVEPGEIFGFLGPNGAGKTTTIRLLMSLLNPDGGEIRLFGESIARNAEKHRERIGYLPGDFSPYGDMTGARFLAYMAKYRSRPPKLRDRLLEQLAVKPQTLSRKIKHLSHGNRQKIGIILALEHEPDLLVLDEPTLGLDPLMQEAFCALLRDMQARGKTVFLSSHILPEVEKNCDRVAIIRDGEVVALQTIENLKNKRHRRVIVQMPEGTEAGPELPSTRLLEIRGNQHVYLVEGDIRPVLRILAEARFTDNVHPGTGSGRRFPGLLQPAGCHRFDRPTMIHLHYMAKALRDHLGLLIFALVVVGLMQLLIFTLVSQLEIVSVIQVVVAQLPAAIRETLGEELLAQTSTRGVVAFGYNHPLVLALMSILAIVLPAKHIAGEIETGAMESILSLPVKRIGIVLSLWLFSTLALFCVLSAAWLGTFMGTVIFQGADVLPFVNVFRIGVNLWLLMITINAYTFLISAYSREGGRAALGAGGLTLFFYFLNVIAGIWPAIGFLRPFSIFYYYRPAQTMAGEGGLAEHLAVLGGLGVVAAAIAMRRIVTRDIPG